MMRYYLIVPLLFVTGGNPVAAPGTAGAGDRVRTIYPAITSRAKIRLVLRTCTQDSPAGAGEVGFGSGATPHLIGRKPRRRSFARSIFFAASHFHRERSGGSGKSGKSR